MTDTLRDRIVAAVTDYLYGVAFIDTGELADAVCGWPRKSPAGR